MDKVELIELKSEMKVKVIVGCMNHNLLTFDVKTQCPGLSVYLFLTMVRYLSYTQLLICFYVFDAWGGYACVQGNFFFRC